MYEFLVRFPDHCYPLPARVQGKRVRGIASYSRAVKRSEAHHHGHIGPVLVAYRTLFHVLGSVLVILTAVFLSRVFGTQTIIYIVFALTVAWIAYQEAYLHPTYYHQIWWKGMIDWIAWTLPLSLYFLF